MRPAVVRRPVGAPLLRGALVGGAAYGMGRRAARNADQDAAQDQAIADLEAQNARLRAAQAPAAPYAPAAPAPAAGGDDLAGKLAQLGAMVQQGLLTPEEFTAAKAKLLG
ncbi:SHOCT domain-containing protein [Streptacidiphilus cavernicola]|uniref:SHOCT domain-containing protein n=1 Tax=Streptacidiphilus cavernicola TaxID=3342716 RepID=A0ABV6VTZ7_9ACTN